MKRPLRAFGSEATLPGNRLCASFWLHLALALCFSVNSRVAWSAGALDRLVTLDIAPNSTLEDALIQWGAQTGYQIMMDANTTARLKTVGVRGTSRASDALLRLLQGSGLTYVAIGNTVTIAPIRVNRDDGSQPDNRIRLADARSMANAGPLGDDGPSESESNRSPEAEERAVPEVLVRGSKFLDTDIKRTEDDAQPYVVFDRDVIQSSGAQNLEEFFKDRLTSNTASVNALQGGAQGRSTINLRGLGAAQTLVLVDGRRLANTSFNGQVQQPDINGIPIGAVERIEVLPTTASGIYGGSATGGVINIILRHDYSGVEAKVAYGNTTRGDNSTQSYSLSGGFNANSGRTRVFLGASYLETDPLTIGDRDFLQRARATLQKNNPTALQLAGIFPPLGATPNIRSQNGSPLFGPGTPSFTSVPIGYVGGGGIAPLAQNAGTYNLNLAESAQAFGGSRFPLLGGSVVSSVMGSLRHELNPTTDLFVEGNASKNRAYFPTNSVVPTSYTIAATAPNNPFGRAIYATIPVSAADGTSVDTTFSQRIAAGAVLHLPRQWSAGFDYTWNRTKIEDTFLPFALTSAAASAISSGAVDILRDLSAAPVDFSSSLYPASTYSPTRSTESDAAMRAAGPIWTLPGGDVKASALLERLSDQYADSLVVSGVPGVGGTIYPGASQSAYSAYLETDWPVISASNELPAVNDLELQIAGRYDHYETRGAVNSVPAASVGSVVHVTNTISSTSPTVALKWKPTQDLMLRASFGSGFLPPSVAQLASTPSTRTTTVLDPSRGNQTTVIPAGGVVTGGNADLRPEKSQSVSFGTVVTPRGLNGLRLSVDYTRIAKKDNIVGLNLTQILANESAFPGRVVRAAPAAGDSFPVGPIVSIDDTLANLTRTTVEIYDAQIAYERRTSIGEFKISATGTLTPHYITQFFPWQGSVENAGINTVSTSLGLNLKFKGSGALEWTYRSWLIAWSTIYFDSYRLDNSTAALGAQYNYAASNGGRSVASQIYHDVLVKYRFSPVGVLKNCDLQLNVANILDKKPPFDPSGSSGLYSILGDPRLRSFQISVTTAF